MFKFGSFRLPGSDPTTPPTTTTIETASADAAPADAADPYAGLVMDKNKPLVEGDQRFTDRKFKKFQTLVSTLRHPSPAQS